MRAFSLVWLVLVLVAGSVTMSMARHQARAVDQVVICTGYGIVSISLDEDGNPTGSILPCPDCTPALSALPHSGMPALVAPAHLVPFRYQNRDQSVTSLGINAFHNARAPPVWA